MAPSAVYLLLLVLMFLEAVLGHYTPTWAVHVPDGQDAADAVARDHGFINLGKVRVKYIFYSVNDIVRLH